MLTFFDFGVLGLTFFFILLGLLRGFVREVFSIINWIAASIATIYLRPVISGMILEKINIPIVADLISNSFLFTTTLIIVSIITSNIARIFRNSVPGPVNVTLGAGFGMVKGYLLSALIFATVFNIYGGSDLSERVGPEWLQSSQTYRPLSLGAHVIKPLTDALFGSFSENRTGTEDKGKILDLIEKKDEVETKSNSSEGTTLKEKIGYPKDQIKKMDRLLNTISD